jgi:hypothetical protein
MTARTRYFVVSSLVVVGLGVGTGLVAYYLRLPLGLQGDQVLEEFRLVPGSASVVAYADVGAVMRSDLRRRVRSILGERMSEDGRREFAEATGIDIEADIDRVVACMDSNSQDGTSGSGLVLARGRFDETRIEALMRERGGTVEEYRSRRLILSPESANMPGRLSLAFVKSGLVAVGSAALVRRAVDLDAEGGESAATNDELMSQIRSLEGGDAWAVGRFDALRSAAKLPDGVTDRLPALTWVSARSNINGGLRGFVQAEARDEEAATNLRDVVQGLLALAKLQTGSVPQIDGVLDSLQLSSAGTTVTLSFDLPGQFFEALAEAAPQPPPDQR